MNANSESDFVSNSDQNSEFKDAIILEPMSLASHPPEPVVTDEEFDKEINLIMMDFGSMDAEPSSAHDLVSYFFLNSLISNYLFCFSIVLYVVIFLLLVS